MSSFVQGQQLTARSVCNHDCVFTGTVVKRTKKTVTVKTDLYGEKRCKVYTDESGEYCYPHGRYSMATIFRAPTH